MKRKTLIARAASLALRRINERKKTMEDNIDAVLIIRSGEKGLDLNVQVSNPDAVGTNFARWIGENAQALMLLFNQCVEVGNVNFKAGGEAAKRAQAHAEALAAVVESGAIVDAPAPAPEPAAAQDA